jgi:hypothetical protein
MKYNFEIFERIRFLTGYYSQTKETTINEFLETDRDQLYFDLMAEIEKNILKLDSEFSSELLFTHYLLKLNPYFIYFVEPYALISGLYSRFCVGFTKPDGIAAAYYDLIEQDYKADNEAIKSYQSKAASYLKIELNGIYYKFNSYGIGYRDIIKSDKSIKIERFLDPGVITPLTEYELRLDIIEPIKWLKTELKLKQLIEALKESGLIENKETNYIIKHFSVNGIETDQNSLEPIKWEAQTKYFSYLIHRLGEEFFINLTKSKFKATAPHFIDKNGDILKVNSLHSALSQIINSDKVKDKNIQQIEDILNSIEGIKT